MRVHQHFVAEWRQSGSPQYDDVVEVVLDMEPLLPSRLVRAVADGVVARTGGYGPLDALLGDSGVAEVMINGGGIVWVERSGHLERTDLRLEREDIEALVARVLAPLGRRVDRSSPLVDARLADGSRINVVVPPLALDGPLVTIRRFGARPVALEAFCPPGVAELLAWAVHARLNLLVSGGTGVGKTTLLNALAASIPTAERVVTIEDAAELRLPGEHVVRLESRPGNSEGVGPVTVRDLVRNALRMRPDRIVVGEVRGPEALDMLQAMNTGHDGSLSTCHANNPADALFRVETMVLMGETALPLGAVRRHMASAIDLIIGLARDNSGDRRVVALAEVTAADSGYALAELAGPDGLERLPSRSPRDPSAAPPSPDWAEL